MMRLDSSPFEFIKRNIWLCSHTIVLNRVLFKFLDYN